MISKSGLFTAEEMAGADALAVEAGFPSLTLMENAGAAVADEAAGMVSAGARIAVLCGPGNNGGDGFVAARLLAARGFGVEVFVLRPVDRLKGDAAAMARRWTGPVGSLADFAADGFALIVDALFGTGRKRPLAADDHRAIAAALHAMVPILAVDIPSGVDANSGAVEMWQTPAERTVTFVGRKLGHVLTPGRWHCGEVRVADIGMPESVLNAVLAKSFNNTGPPNRGIFQVDQRAANIHKYTRGHVVVVSGPAESTGAARLGARAALRSGAGLVTVASPRDALLVNAAHLTAIMVRAFDAPVGLATILADRRINTVLIGPGAGVGDATRRMVEQVFAAGAVAVLDADALTSFEAEPDLLFALTRAAAVWDDCLPDCIMRAAVMTPHEGEFKRLFPDLQGSKVKRAVAAAKRSGAIVVLKGPDTVIAEPGGTAAINENAPAWLATAGSGDVLAGFIAGLAAQGMHIFNAARLAVWLHGECATEFGPGLIAEDLPEALPRVLGRISTP